MSSKEIAEQIRQLEIKKLAQEEKEFADLKKKGWFAMLQAEYESASYKTPEFLSFYRIFKNQFTKLLKENFPIKEIRIGKAGHFEVDGFVELENGNIYYFNLGDLRWDKTFMIRTAESFDDYTGGSNDYLNTEDYESFMIELRRVLK